ncbi:MAG: DNA-3-methyladenine glycosylase 2 family protein [Saprospiraceae bacterium]|nr:DNA-3-methyladenine glycosylase 2 family protein [Saprospiraceae bacterium]
MFSPDREIIRFLQKDKILASAINKVSLIIEKPVISLFEHLVASIVSQQLSTKAAKTIYTRFREGFTSQSLHPEDVLLKSPDELRNYGLSYQKASYIHNISRYFIENNLLDNHWHKNDDDTIIKTLIPIKGVGLWTIQMILIFHLMRDDVFPVDDLAIRNRMILWYGVEGDTKNQIHQLHQIAEDWRPYRSWACRYIWAAGDMFT